MLNARAAFITDSAGFTPTARTDLAAGRHVMKTSMKFLAVALALAVTAPVAARDNDRDDRREQRQERQDDRREARQDRRGHQRDARNDRRNDNRGNDNRRNDGQRIVHVRHRNDYRPGVRVDVRPVIRSSVRHDLRRDAYRYRINGRYWNTNQYGVNLIRDAANRGYAEGVRAGQMARRDGWRYNYRGARGWRDGGHGYNVSYFNRDHYQHYYREGFQRGYEDGYYSRSRYGRHDNGQYFMIAAILAAVLGVQSL